MTGDDDPDDRRTYPWAGHAAAQPDTALYAHYKALTALRTATRRCRTATSASCSPTTRPGRSRTAARRATTRAIVAINRGELGSRRSHIPVAGYLPDGTSLTGRLRRQRRDASTRRRARRHARPARGGVVLDERRRRPDAAGGAAGLARRPSTGDGRSQLAWNAVARRGRLRRLPQPGHAAAATCASARRPSRRTTVHATPACANAPRVLLRRPRARRGRQRERRLERGAGRAASRDRLGEPAVAADARPHDQRVEPDGQRLRPGLDRRRDQPAGPDAGPPRRSSASARDGINPSGNAPGRGSTPSFNIDAGNNDEFVAVAPAGGDRDVSTTPTATRPRTAATGSTPTSTGPGNGYSPAQAGKMTVHASRPTRPRRRRRRLHVVSAPRRRRSTLAWDPVPATRPVRLRGLPRRPPRAARTALGLDGPATTATPTPVVTEGATYYYVVRAVDTSFNQSGRDVERGDRRAAEPCTLDVQRDGVRADDRRHRTRRSHIAGKLAAARRRTAALGPGARRSR